MKVIIENDLVETQIGDGLLQKLYKKFGRVVSAYFLSALLYPVDSILLIFLGKRLGRNTTD